MPKDHPEEVSIYKLCFSQIKRENGNVNKSYHWGNWMEINNHSIGITQKENYFRSFRTHQRNEIKPIPSINIFNT